jgi:phosphoglycerate dehydrogenase-like enzyme
MPDPQGPLNFVVPDDYDKVYLGTPHLERLAPHGRVEVYTDPPRDEGELMARSDFVSIHIRSLPATKGLITRDLIGLMKPGAFLINTARAAIVDEDALWEALSAGRLAGAGLDVFGEEPLPTNHRWAALSNLVLTSHRGWVTRETLDRFMGAAVENTLAFLAGRPVNVVNPEALG